MDRELANRVVDCLRLKGSPPDFDRLRGFTERDWQRTRPWLDRTGLALYLLRRLQNLRATEVFPPLILRLIENDLAQNCRRVDHVASRFAAINEGFYRAGVNFAVVKGFSLVPEFCPDLNLRPLVDLDYLVEKQSRDIAQRVLTEAGYRLQRATDSTVVFSIRSSRIPAHSDNPYSWETEPLVELHLGIWEQDVTAIALTEPEFRLDQTVNHEWQGLHFPVLRREDAFVLQIIHIFQHVISGWVKLCWLIELGYFLEAQPPNTAFWDRVEVRMQEVPLLTQFGSVVMGLARTLLGTTVPPQAERWFQDLSPAARLWLERYGRTFVIEDCSYVSFRFLSATKFSIFLQCEFIGDHRARQEVIRRRLFPWNAPKRAPTLINRTVVDPAAIRQQSQFVFRRLIYHLGSGLRFLWELPRWQELSRRANEPVSPAINSDCTNSVTSGN